MLQNSIEKVLLLLLGLMLTGCGQLYRASSAEGSAGQVDVPVSVQRDYMAAIANVEANDDVAGAKKLAAFISAHPEYPSAYINLAIIYDRQNRSDEAVALLNQALQLDPDSVQALNQLGVTQRQRGELDAAEQAWLLATEKDPDYTFAWYNLGVFYDLYMQDLPAALDHYRRYQKLTDSADQDPAVARWVTDLERRIGTPARAAQASEIK